MQRRAAVSVHREPRSPRSPGVSQLLGPLGLKSSPPCTPSLQIGQRGQRGQTAKSKPALLRGPGSSGPPKTIQTLKSLGPLGPLGLTSGSHVGRGAKHRTSTGGSTGAGDAAAEGSTSTAGISTAGASTAKASMAGASKVGEVGESGAAPPCGGSAAARDSASAAAWHPPQAAWRPFGSLAVAWRPGSAPAWRPLKGAAGGMLGWAEGEPRQCLAAGGGVCAAALHRCGSGQRRRLHAVGHVCVVWCCVVLCGHIHVILSNWGNQPQPPGTLKIAQARGRAALSLRALAMEGGKVRLRPAAGGRAGRPSRVARDRRRAGGDRRRMSRGVQDGILSGR